LKAGLGRHSNSAGFDSVQVNHAAIIHQIGGYQLQAGDDELGRQREAGPEVLGDPAVQRR
jgi:hypothetical protein